MFRFQVHRQNRRVNLRRGKVRVAEHPLDQLHVGPAAQHVRGEGVTEDVAFHLRAGRDGPHVPPHHPPHRPAHDPDGREREAGAQAGGEEDRTDYLRQPRFQRLRADPLPGQNEGEQRKHEGRRAKALEAQIGQIRSRVTDEIQRMGFRSGIPRRILGVVRDQAQEGRHTE